MTHSHKSAATGPTKATITASFGGVYPGWVCMSHQAPTTPTNAATTCEVRIMTGAYHYV